MILCTPDSVALPGQQRRAAGNPIVEALRMASPGTTIELAPGDYPGFGIGFNNNYPWNAKTSGGTRNSPIVVRGFGRVRIRARTDAGDTITIDQGVPNGHITFRDLEIEPGYRAGVLFTKQEGGRAHEGYRFLDCDIIGGWDHVNDRGANSKWGVYGHSLADFEFRGLSRKAIIRDIRHEHGFYLQNPKGNLTIENVYATRLGRTFCQFTAREKDGDPGLGKITVRDCVVEDVCISRWDGFKGGSAFTVAGRLRGTVLLERNSYRSGFDPELRKLTTEGVPYGTGAVACWDEKYTIPNAAVVLKDNDFEMAPGCGDRALVAIGGCQEVYLLGKNRLVAGANRIALDLDPTQRDGGTLSIPNGVIYVDPSTEIRGRAQWRGKRAGKVELRWFTTERGKRDRFEKPWGKHMAKIREEDRRREEERQAAEQRRAEEELRRLEEERVQVEEELRRLEEERVQAEEAERLRKQQARREWMEEAARRRKKAAEGEGPKDGGDSPR